MTEISFRPHQGKNLYFIWVEPYSKKKKKMFLIIYNRTLGAFVFSRAKWLCKISLPKNCDQRRLLISVKANPAGLLAAEFCYQGVKTAE